ncbi:MAG: anti-sigma factor [Geitlerinemataceae cyanobacterium]
MVSPLPPDCEQLLISGYILGNLSAAEATLLEELLAENPQMREQIAEVQTALELAYAPPEVTPPEALRDRILAASEQIMAAEREGELSSAVPPAPHPRLNWWKALGVAAVASILGLGLANYRLWQALQAVQVETPQSATIAYSLAGNDRARGAVARLNVDPDRLDATLRVDNLPELPPGKVYVLWTVVSKDAPFTTDEKGAILTDVFQVNEEGEFSGKIVVPPAHRDRESIAKVAVTIEDESAPQAHEGSIIMASSDRS